MPRLGFIGDLSHQAADDLTRCAVIFCCSSMRDERRTRWGRARVVELSGAASCERLLGTGVSVVYGSNHDQLARQVYRVTDRKVLLVLSEAVETGSKLEAAVERFTSNGEREVVVELVGPHSAARVRDCYPGGVVVHGDPAVPFSAKQPERAEGPPGPMAEVVPPVVKQKRKAPPQRLPETDPAVTIKPPHTAPAQPEPVAVVEEVQKVQKVRARKPKKSESDES